MVQVLLSVSEATVLFMLYTESVALNYLPQAIANAIDGIKPYFKECNLLK